MGRVCNGVWNKREIACNINSVERIGRSNHALALAIEATS
jgi:hypothetical protein